MHYECRMGEGLHRLSQPPGPIMLGSPNFGLRWAGVRRFRVPARVEVGIALQEAILDVEAVGRALCVVPTGSEKCLLLIPVHVSSFPTQLVICTNKMQVHASHFSGSWYLTDMAKPAVRQSTPWSRVHPHMIVSSMR